MISKTEESKISTKTEKSSSALGTFPKTEEKLAKAYANIATLFSTLPKPKPGEWLYEHKEAGQTFDQFYTSGFHQVTPKQKTIYIQPLETEVGPDMLEVFQKFLTAYFPGMSIKINDYINVEKEREFESRINEYTNKKQYHAGTILTILKRKVPKDAYCVIACSMTDLYPRDSWNFVFGLASLKERVGVFSFARYDESFFDESLPPTDPGVIIYRSCKVMAHEIGHMFGIKHCVHYSCLMNGSNHAEEASKKPVEYCPVCLRKLQTNLKFDLRERYMGLAKCFEELSGSFKPHTDWYLKAYLKAVEAYSKESKEKASTTIKENLE